MWQRDKYSYISESDKKKKEYIKESIKKYKRDRFKRKLEDFKGWVLSYISVWKDEKYKGDDEFHESLNMSPYYHYMGQRRQKKYLKKLLKRREEIHERTLFSK